MKTKMLIAAVLSASMFAVTTAAALPLTKNKIKKPVSLTTGFDGGSYQNVGERLSEKMLIAGWKRKGSIVIPSNGTEQNAIRVFDGVAILNEGEDDEHEVEIKYAIMQGDADDQYAMESPEYRKHTQVIGEFGLECTFLAGNTDDTSFDSEDDLEEGVNLGVGAAGGGTSWSYKMLGKLDSGLGSATPKFDELDTQLSMMERQDAEAPDMVMFTTNPYVLGDALKQVLRSDKLELIDLNDHSLNNKLGKDAGPGLAGRQIYKFYDVKVGNQKVEVPCTMARLVGNTDLIGTKELKAAKRLMRKYGAEIWQGK